MPLFIFAPLDCLVYYSLIYINDKYFHVHHYQFRPYHFFNHTPLDNKKKFNSWTDYSVITLTLIYFIKQ